jgi:hypothetical protein
MKKFWAVTLAMIGGGIALALGSVVFGLGPIALLCGLLLLWSGIVKAVVLRVWGATLPAPPLAEPIRANRQTVSAGEPR